MTTKTSGAPGEILARALAYPYQPPDFGFVSGPFQITALEYAGSHNGEATYEIALSSAGALIFVAL